MKQDLLSIIKSLGIRYKALQRRGAEALGRSEGVWFAKFRM